MDHSSKVVLDCPEVRSPPDEGVTRLLLDTGKEGMVTPVSAMVEQSFVAVTSFEVKEVLANDFINDEKSRSKEER